MKKKFMAFILSMIVIATVVGCGANGNTDENTVTKNDEAASVSEEANGDESMDKPDIAEEESPVTISKDNVNYLDVLEDRALSEMSVFQRNNINIPVNVLMPPDEYVCEDFVDSIKDDVFMYGSGRDEKTRIGFDYESGIPLRNRGLRGEGESCGNYILYTQDNESERGYTYYIHIIEDGADYGAEICFSTANLDFVDATKEIAAKNLEYIREQLNNL